jgi:hypothetical protein
MSVGLVLIQPNQLIINVYILVWDLNFTSYHSPIELNSVMYSVCSIPTYLGMCIDMSYKQRLS